MDFKKRKEEKERINKILQDLDKVLDDLTKEEKQSKEELIDLKQQQVNLENQELEKSQQSIENLEEKSEVKEEVKFNSVDLDKEQKTEQLEKEEVSTTSKFEEEISEEVFASQQNKLKEVIHDINYFYKNINIEYSDEEQKQKLDDPDNLIKEEIEDLSLLKHKVVSKTNELIDIDLSNHNEAKKEDSKEDKFEKSKFKEIEKSQSVKEEVEKIAINTAFFYPSDRLNVKELFFKNINTTLLRVSKKPVELVPVFCLDYNNLDRDIILNYDKILDEIKNNDIKVLFLIIEESSIAEQYLINEFMSFVLVAKSIKFKDLSLSSTYIDISVDLLLIIK